MKLVGDFLARFKSLAPPNDSLRGAISQSLEQALEIRCPKEKISIVNGVAHVKVSSVAKNMIHVHRSKVLEILFEKIPKARDSVRDIR